MNSKIIAYSNFDYKPKKFDQLELFPSGSRSGKPQISSIPGISPKRRDRYQVKLGNEILATHLTIDEALRLAKRGGK